MKYMKQMKKIIIMLKIIIKFKGFNGAISCIEQQKSNGNILITCWDGNVYLFEKVNLEQLLEKRLLNKNIFNQIK